MTRQMRQVFHCLKCGTANTAETAFSAWLRTRPELDSKQKGLAISDIDYIVHKYKAYGARRFQCIMFIEMKTHGGSLSASQADTLWTIDQLLRNRRDTPSKKSRKQCDGALKKTYSLMAGREITIKSFGYHSLIFSHLDPEDSDWIKWDKRKNTITKDQLIGLLKFDLDPDTLTPLDLRSHHRSAYAGQLSFWASEFEHGKSRLI